MKDLNDLSVHDLAADYKYRGYDRYRAWDQFIFDRYLNPGIDANDFYEVFDTVKPRPLINLKFPADFRPNHFDRLRRCLCEITVRDDGAIKIRWDDGYTGGYYPYQIPEEGRYIKINDEKDGK